MQRPIQHIIETESKKKLNSIIPDHWVLRELPLDYGLDFMVEIFKEGRSTGNIFYLQLKGSGQNIKNNIISYQLNKEHIEYYSSIPTPILFVLYSTKTKQFWGIWANQLKDIIIEEGSTQKTFTIKLGETHILNMDFFAELEKSFTFDLPKKINLSIISNSENGILFHQQLLKWIKYYFGEFVEVENSLLPTTILFKYNDVSEKSLSISVSNTMTIFKLDAVDITDDAFLFLPILDTNNCPSQFNEMLIWVSILLHKYNVKSSIELITKTLDESCQRFLNPIHIFEIIKKGIEENSILEIQNLSKSSLEKNIVEIFQFINLSILTFDNEKRLTGLYKDNLLFALENLKDKSLIGVLSYNLANSYRSTQELYLASKYYHVARKNEPGYLEKFYWWYEYAGVLFLASHYLLSEKFYRKSYKLNKGYNVPSIYSLIGDALFFQGKFTVAKNEFDKFLSIDSNIPNEAIFLKKKICENFILSNLDNVAFDIPKSKELTEQAFFAQNPQKLAEAIEIYPLNGLAWFNYGVFLNDNNDLENAFTAFLTAACIQDWDKEAWKNCLLISMNLKKKDEIILIYNVMLDKFGVESLNYISEHFLKDSTVDKALIADLIKMLSDLAIKRGRK